MAKDIFEIMAEQEAKEKIKWDGKIHIISDKKFLAVLTDSEYHLYVALKGMSHHNSNGQHHIYKNEVKFEDLSKKLELFAGNNKKGEQSFMSRQTISKLFKSLEKQGVIKLGNFEDGREVYFIINEDNYKFTKVNKETIELMVKCIKGQVVKTYIYIKANFEYNKKNGNETHFTRETIATAIGEINKKGEIGERQLKNITLYTTLLYNLSLLDIHIEKRKNNDGTYSARYKINNVSDKLKKIPKK